MRLGLGLGQEASAAPGSPWVALVSAHLPPRGLHQLHRMGLQTLSSQEPRGAGKVFVPRGPLSSSRSQKRRRRRRVSSHELFLQ